MTAVAALTFGGLMTSCTKDTDLSGPEATQSITEKYEQIFVTAFGQPAPTQTWGFGDNSTASTRAITRATEAEWTDYAKSMSDYLQWQVSDMQAWTALSNDVLTSYPNGNHTLNDLQYMEGQDVGKYYGDGDGHHYFIPSGTTITERFNVGEGATLDNVVLYVEGKAVITSSNNLNAITLVVGNGGEIEFQGENRMSTTGRFVVARGGKITGTEGTLFGIENAGSCYNAGEINFDGTLRVNGSDFYNCGTINVDILTGTSGGTTITNFGSITARTNAIQAEAYNGIYVNACHLTFTENAGIGQLTLLNNSRLDVGGQLYITGENTMYNMSEINANSIYWQDGKITGPSGAEEFSVIKSTKFLVSHANDINTYNNVYYDMDKTEFYNYQGVKVDINNNYSSAHHIIGGGTTDNEWAEYWCKAPIRLWANQANLYIPAGECTGTGYTSGGGGGGGGDTDPEVVRIIAEDLTWGSENGDFDFNDVIFDVQLIDNGSNIRITLLAAGGTLPLYIAGVEVHEKFGVSTSTMVNTYTDNNGNLIKDHNPVSFTIPNQDKKNYVLDANGNETYPPYGSTVKEVAWKLPVEVLKLLSNGNRGLVELTAPVGKAAAKVAVGNDYNDWCPERTSVDDKFFDQGRRKGKFSMYVKKEVPYAEDNSWYR